MQYVYASMVRHAQVYNDNFVGTYVREVTGEHLLVVSRAGLGNRTISEIR